MTDDGLLVEGLGVLIIEDGAWWDQRVGHGLAGGLADSQFDAGGIDVLLPHEVLAGVECTFCGGFRLLLWIGVADHDQAGVGLLLEC